jgi:serine/threonine protein kinase
VALKVLPPVFPADDAEMQHFVRALKPAFALHHPGLVALRGLGRSGPYVWIAAELVEGESVASAIVRFREAGKGKWRLALRVALHIGRVLDFLHHRRLVHANITPANLLLSDGEGQARLTDLGLWDALMGSVLQRERLEQKLVAELPYLSPEHIDPDAPVDALSDQYSLGAVVYALLTGRPPCEGKTTEETMARIRDTMPLRPKEFHRSAPDELQAAVLRMLAKRPEERYAAPGPLLADLEAIAAKHGEKV